MQVTALVSGRPSVPLSVTSVVFTGIRAVVLTPLTAEQLEKGSKRYKVDFADIGDQS